MKMTVEIAHGWCAAMSRCENCTHMFVVVRKRNNPILNVRCPECGMPGKVWHMETPWTGIVEVDVDDERS